MNIIDDIVYSVNKYRSINVVSVRPLSNFRLWLLFSTSGQEQEEKVFDVTPLLAFPAYAPLKDTALFATATVDHGVVVWMDGEIDVSPEKMYAEGIAVCD